MSYENFAYYYDSLMDDQFYEDYYQFILQQCQFEEVFELGCGTGEMAIRLAKNHKTVYASDLSSDMLEVAKQKAIEQNVNLVLQRVDMSDFTLSRPVDLILCLCDSMNYLLEPQQIIQTFQNVFQSLNNQGTFIFDIDSLYKMNVILKDYHEKEEDEEFVFEWKVEKIDDGYVHHHVYIEDKLNGDIVDEDHYQKTYPVSQYLYWLNEVGFKAVEYFSDFSSYHDDCERIIFVCRKGNEK
ncbi:class I SAM-dependent methyltransferase [Allocoprobacillus halotolerans]|uniref:Class I SAM-dependent methyltransferase n=1 Tax=Allocoprobacillus halotolerans TaxID=2944914 RepID=A0ABY5I220_9FIRM|nr:class I SAM-dependent methyltransferase [Allocoprobacillus halotolerans]UTY38763.1 class I SAM-dependent methyltransferase [Allocoprobacillus halotolerans]